VELKSGYARSVDHTHIANKGKLIVGATQGDGRDRLNDFAMVKLPVLLS
jgi:hypothetical protein